MEIGAFPVTKLFAAFPRAIIFHPIGCRNRGIKRPRTCHVSAGLFFRVLVSCDNLGEMLEIDGSIPSFFTIFQSDQSDIQ